MNWNLKINLKLEGQDVSLDLTSGEQSLLTMLRGFYPQFEAQIKGMAQKRPGELPTGLLDDVLTLLRCLVFNKLEAYRGEHLRIAKVAS
jgi:hypothetical protein